MNPERMTESLSKFDQNEAGEFYCCKEDCENTIKIEDAVLRQNKSGYVEGIFCSNYCLANQIHYEHENTEWYL